MATSVCLYFFTVQILTTVHICTDVSHLHCTLYFLCSLLCASSANENLMSLQGSIKIFYSILFYSMIFYGIMCFLFGVVCKFDFIAGFTPDALPHATFHPDPPNHVIVTELHLLMNYFKKLHIHTVIGMQRSIE